MEYQKIELKSGKNLQFPTLEEADSDKITLEMYDLFVEMGETEDPVVSYKVFREITKNFLPTSEATKWNKLTISEFQEAMEQVQASGEAGKE